MNTTVRIVLLVMWVGAEVQAFPAARSVGLKVGSVHPDRHFQNMPAVGLEMEVGKTSPNLCVVPFAEYSAGGGAAGRPWRVMSYGVSLLRLHRFRYTATHVYYGGGLGFALGRFSMLDGNELDLALNVLTGVSTPLNRRFALNLTAKYLLTGNMNHLSAWFGISQVLEKSLTE